MHLLIQQPGYWPDTSPSNLWINQHSVPLAQYGHYWSSVGGLLNDDETSEMESSPQQDGASFRNHMRKISNIPMGDTNLDQDEEPTDIISPMDLSTNQNDQNGHPFNMGTTGVRDVRIKKTMFQNLSPYRK